MKIKVCGMREMSNIKELCSLPIDYIGFIFYKKSPRYVREILTQESINLIPQSIQKTGVFVNEDFETIISTAKEYSLDAIQLHGQESPELCQAVQENNLTVLKAFGVNEEFDFATTDPYIDFCDYFLFDTKSPAHGGTGVKFDWSVLNYFNNKKPFFLSGGISIDDIEEIKKLDLNIHALDLNSKFEIQPAFKDIETLKTFINSL